MTRFGFNTEFTIGPGGIEEPIGLRVGRTFLNIANNLIAGQTTGTTVLIYPGGHEPHVEIAYGNSESVPLPPCAFVMIEGDGANVTYAISTDPVPIGAVTVQTVQNDQIGVSSSSQVTGLAGTGSAGVGVGTSDTLMYSLANPSANRKIIHLPLFAWSFGGQIAAGTLAIKVEKTQNVDATVRPVIEVSVAYPSSGTIEGSIGPESNAVGSPAGFTACPTSTEIILLPGQTLEVYASSTQGGTLVVDSDFYSVPE